MNLPHLKILAPNDRITAIGENRTFLLQVSEVSNQPIKVSITQPKVSDTLWLDEMAINNSGIIEVTIPDKIQLESKTDYIFTASIPCGENHLSGSKFVRIFFEYDETKLSENQNDLNDIVISELLNNDVFFDALFLSYQQRLPEFKEILEKEGIEIN